MRIVMTGATGFVGRAAARELADAGHAVVVLSRDAGRARAALPFAAAWHDWPSLAELPPRAALEGAGAVINLAGENLSARRWSARQKAMIRDSRVAATERLAAAVRDLGDGPEVFINASAVGYYGNRGDDELSEASAGGSGFLAEVCKAWEGVLFAGELAATRRVALRTGMVVGPGGGALGALLPIFRAGLGGPAGGGRQWVSWIALSDLVALIRFALDTAEMAGPLNAVAPRPVTNRELAQALASALRRPAVLPAPAMALRLVLGEMAGLVLEGQRVVPAEAQRLGFTFRHESIASALHEALGR